jgi:hypothetical protein
MTQHATRWSGTFTGWYNNTQQLRSFIAQRCNNLAGGFVGCYNVTGPHNLVLNTDPVGAGTIKLNSVTINSFPWTGQYFGNITTSLTANANQDYAFTNWTPGTQVFNPGNTTQSVNFDLAGSDSITAHFISTTYLPEVPGAEPSVSIFPTLVSNSATIEINLPERLKVSMGVYSVLGDQVLRLEAPELDMSPGVHQLSLNLSGSSLSSGIYFLDFRAGSYRKTIKFMYSPE